MSFAITGADKVRDCGSRTVDAGREALTLAVMICLVANSPDTFKGWTTNICHVISPPDASEPQAVDLGLTVNLTTDLGYSLR